MKTVNPSHIEKVKQQNAMNRKKIQELFRLDDLAYCELQLDVYLAYTAELFPALLPGEKEPDRSLFRQWFLENWNKKDQEFLNDLDFDGPYFTGLFCIYKKKSVWHMGNGQQGTCIDFIPVNDSQELYEHYVKFQATGFIFHEVPKIVLRKAFA